MRARNPTPLRSVDAIVTKTARGAGETRFRTTGVMKVMRARSPTFPWSVGVIMTGRRREASPGETRFWMRLMGGLSLTFFQSTNVTTTERRVEGAEIAEGTRQLTAPMTNAGEGSIERRRKAIGRDLVSYGEQRKMPCQKTLFSARLDMWDECRCDNGNFDLASSKLQNFKSGFVICSERNSSRASITFVFQKGGILCRLDLYVESSHQGLRFPIQGTGDDLSVWVHLLVTYVALHDFPKS